MRTLLKNIGLVAIIVVMPWAALAEEGAVSSMELGISLKTPPVITVPDVPPAISNALVFLRELSRQVEDYHFDVALTLNGRVRAILVEFTYSEYACSALELSDALSVRLADPSIPDEARVRLTRDYVFGIEESLYDVTE